MNIFYFDEDIEVCAQYHCDSHVIKMILESAQILCAVLWLNKGQAPYRPTHKNHPCVLWANRSLANWYWLRKLAEALNKEYRHRFNHLVNHKSYEVILTLTPPSIADLGLTSIMQVVPDEYKSDNPALAYRRYFIACKLHLAKWTNRGAPPWFYEEIVRT